MRQEHGVQKKTVVDTVLDAIIADIVSKKYPPGSKLPNEYELISRLNVSRNSLREAIKILSAMGIVEIRHGDGTYVCTTVAPSVIDSVVYSMISPLSSSEELIELRQIVDEATVRQAIDKILPEEITLLQESVSDMRRAISENNITKATELDYQFHMDLIAFCKNTLFIRIMTGLYSIFRSSIGQTIHLERVDSQAPRYHQSIIDCIKNKDYQSVHHVVSDSLITWRNQL